MRNLIVRLFLLLIVTVVVSCKHSHKEHVFYAIGTWELNHDEGYSSVLSFHTDSTVGIFLGNANNPRKKKFYTGSWERYNDTLYLTYPSVNDTYILLVDNKSRTLFDPKTNQYLNRLIR